MTPRQIEGGGVHIPLTTFFLQQTLNLVIVIFRTVLLVINNLTQFLTFFWKKR